MAKVTAATLADAHAEAGTQQARTPLEHGFAAALAGDADLEEVSLRVSDGRVSFGRISLAGAPGVERRHTSDEATARCDRSILEA